jgi:hypothetical protein
MQDPDEKEMANIRQPNLGAANSRNSHPVARRYYRVGWTAGQGFESNTRSTSVVGPGSLQPSFAS